tara:strand:- start:830 stop:1006 length:177 start_codon:yes stop_codon:yes gene_type:complete
MPKYKIIFTIEVNTEAADYEEAEMIARDCVDWANADIEVLLEEEIDDDKRKIHGRTNC